MSNFVITRAYSLDCANFLNLLTGDPFYVSRHEEAYAAWNPRLSPTAREGVASAAELLKSRMLGPNICHGLPLLTDFRGRNLADLLASLDHSVGEQLGIAPEWWVVKLSAFEALLPAVRELELLGFRSNWEQERVPLIEAAADLLAAYLASLRLDVTAEVSAMLGPGATDLNLPIEVYLCSFAAPHGIRIAGRRYVSDVRYEPELTLRIAIHEMFHPPYRLEDVKAEADGLIADPLFQESFRTKDPKYGYGTETGFLEENIVEAMELFVSWRAGLIADPIAYLQKHDDGSHKLSVLLFRYFVGVPKEASESFADYLRRLVRVMPIGNLQTEYEAELQAWRSQSGASMSG